MLAVVIRDGERDFVVRPFYEVPCNFMAHSRDFLIDYRLVVPHIAQTGVHHQIAVGIEAHLGAGNRESDGLRIGARSYYKIVFQLLLVAVVEQIHSGVNAFIPHLRKSRVRVRHLARSLPMKEFTVPFNRSSGVTRGVFAPSIFIRIAADFPEL